MARYGAKIESIAAAGAGLPSGTTLNGWLGYWAAASGTGFRVRRVKVGVRATGVPTSQQYSLALFKQTVAPAGTGLASSVPGQAFESWTPSDPTGGFIAATATSVGTTGPTLAAQAIDEITLNTQSYGDVPWEFMEELVIPSGAANGFAIVNIGAPLPSTHLFTISMEIEV